MIERLINESQVDSNGVNRVKKVAMVERYGGPGRKKDKTPCPFQITREYMFISIYQKRSCQCPA